MTSRLMQVELGQTYCVKLNYRATQNSFTKQLVRLREAGGVYDAATRTYSVTPSTPKHQCQLNWLIKNHGVRIVDLGSPSAPASLS